MDGDVDGHGRALVEVLITDPEENTTPLEVWIDTGFTYASMSLIIEKMGTS